MAASTELFTTVVERVFNNWTALRLAVEHNMGGFQSKEVALQLVNIITEMFKKHNVSVEDIADFLIDYMDSEFQTICEDNSPDEVAAVLWQFHQKYLEGNVEFINLELSKLPTTDNWLSKPVVQGNQQQWNKSQSDENSGQNTLMETEEEEDPEWTHVKTRRRRDKVAMD
ncbi:hypothetical protein C0J52_04068 [Blattella germanica]|nr:hypothetical protein C0J52_04068 [Blattella germanica]